MYKLGNDVKDNFYLGARGVGASKKLLGNVEILSVFISEEKGEWPSLQKNGYFSAIKKASDFLMREAKRYGATLNITGSHFDTTIPSGTNHKDGYEIVKDFFNRDTVQEAQEYYENKGDFDETPFILVFNKRGRSFARKRNVNAQYDAEEISVVYYDKTNRDENAVAVIVHELLHQFGATDFYFPSRVKKVATKYIGKSIMTSYDDLHIDDLTAYLIGWKDTISRDSYQFLKDTMWMNKREYYKAVDDEWK